MENKPIVSIIVPCYKQAEYLPETLESVLAQTYRDWECIVVNDGSPDDTEAVAKRYCEKDARIKYLYQENQGVAMARNNGIRHSSGKYILPLDGDDKIENSYLEKAVNSFEEHPEVSLVYSRTKQFGDMTGECWTNEYSWGTIIWGNMIPNTAMYRRADYDRTCGYNPNMVHGYEDWDFWLSLLDSDSKVYRIEEPLYCHRSKAVSRAVLNARHENWVQSHRQLYLNHKDIYKDYAPDLIMLHNQSFELENIKKSKAYLWGERIAKVYRKIRYKE